MEAKTTNSYTISDCLRHLTGCDCERKSGYKCENCNKIVNLSVCYNLCNSERCTTSDSDGNCDCKDVKLFFSLIFKPYFEHHRLNLEHFEIYDPESYSKMAY